MNATTRTQHTPGPWRYHDGEDQGLSVRVAKNTTIAAVSDEVDEYEANARLIAAAPDLLAALRVLLAYLPDPQDAVDPQQHAALLVAREAIRKAEGSAS